MDLVTKKELNPAICEVFRAVSRGVTSHWVFHSESHASHTFVAWTVDELYWRSVYGLLHWKGIDTFVSPAFLTTFADDFASDDIDDFTFSAQ